jgi:hypothetical protein
MTNCKFFGCRVRVWIDLDRHGSSIPGLRLSHSLANMQTGFFCIHPDCDRVYERWNGLQKHNNREHRDDVNFVDLSTGKTAVLLQQKLARCCVYTESDATATSPHSLCRLRSVTFAELQELENKQTSSKGNRQVKVPCATCCAQFPPRAVWKSGSPVYCDR